MTGTTHLKYAYLTLAAGALSLGVSAAHAQTFTSNVIIQGSLCVGFDCVTGESFGFDTIRLKENNTRIKFQDTSNSASFPTQDWQITANDSSNGGANKFSIDAISPATGTPFTIEAGAPSHSLYVDDGGRIGFGTSTPVVELHVKDGDTPTLRLEQDGSSGFTAQTWDVAGNETNFFVRDVTTGSRLPFRIRSGAPTSAIDVEGTGDVGVGTTSPDAALDVERTGADRSEPLLRLFGDMAANQPHLLIDAAEAAGGGGAGRAEIWFQDSGGAGDAMRLQLNDDDFNLTFNGTGGAELTISQNGDVEVGNGNLRVTGGNIFVGATQLAVPDYVFADDYELMPLYEVEKFIAENRHLPNIPSAAEVNAGQLNMTEMQMTLLEKVEELTLYTLEQQKTIDRLQQRLDTLDTD